jgi:myo-inositol catabolism protein IolH
VSFLYCAPHTRTLAEVEFDGIATVCVLAWEERARESSVHNLDRIREYLAKHTQLRH